MIVVLALIQRHTIFLRPITAPNSESTDCYFDASIDESTSFAYKNDLNESYLVDTPETGSSLYDRMTFSWSNELFCRGIANGLNVENMYRLASKDAQILNWKRYLHQRKAGQSMFMALLLTFVPETALKAVYTVLITILGYASPFFLQRILRYIESTNDTGSTDTLRNAYLDAFGLLFFANLNSVFNGQGNWISAAVSIQIKSFIRGELSIKTLRRRGKGSWDSSKKGEKGSISKDSQSFSDDGRIVNLIDTDMSRVSDILYFLEDVFSLPISLGIGLFYIYKLLGISALIGLSVVVLYIPLSKMIFGRVVEIQIAQRNMSDKRISMITEVLQGIKAVKLFGWETRFMKNIAEQHGYQLKYNWKVFSWRVVLNVVSELMPVAVFVLILYLYAVVFGNKLTAEIAFTSLSVFHTVYNAILQVENYFTSLTDIFVSIDRMNTYLSSSNTQSLEKRVASNTDNALGFKCADLEWVSTEEKDKDKANGSAAEEIPPTEQTPLLSGESSSTPISGTANVSSVSLAKLDNVSPFSLKDIDVQFPLGGFSIVAGPTGSGKSSLLSALIGEMTLTRGSIMVPTLDSKIASAGESKYKDIVDIANEGLALHDIAYVAQEPWLRNATIRENILFGETYEKERYEEVLRVCALKPDLRILPAGDETEIGERGVTLSGGQKQRLTVARAVYSRHRILLIDDCLSAVDAHTGKHILMKCLLSRTKLMQGRTRVLITHHVPMCLPYADFIVMLNNGRVVLKGDPQELKTQSVLTNVLKELDNSSKSADKGKNKAKDNDNTDETAGNFEENMEQTLNDTKSEDEYTLERFQEIAKQKGMDINTNVSVLQGILIKEEEHEKGRVKLEVWKTFVEVCGGNAYWAVLIGILITAELFSTMKNYAIRLWVSSNDGNDPDNEEFNLQVINGYIYNERNMNAVERVMQYLKIDQEKAAESTPENKPPALWPKSGNVEIENLVAEYVPGVPVLHGISLSVRHGEKIGVVGRTGAGKSTMSLALLRFIEASKGRVVLDGVDISTIGLEDLRRNITIIPQDPVLFNGTVRYNIDPFEEYPDELIWDALRRTHLTREQSSQTTSASASIMEDTNTDGELALERMTGIFGSLDDEIKQNGQSLSLGQRQLVAMARALVRRSKLIIMDEATASVDFDTDKKLQRTIRGYEFANSTLFCIAHRLRTIIDYDRVLVLDKGKVIEFDTPKNLLRKKDGTFRRMCEKTGEYEYLETLND
ncbi:hypothetical protein LPJ74_006517 [Coemansia sp. RSA 1843]|nr:hypothetical protein LPJ74_006517 [Coemansia sp. RSA 1843]